MISTRFMLRGQKNTGWILLLLAGNYIWSSLPISAHRLGLCEDHVVTGEGMMEYVLYGFLWLLILGASLVW